MGMTASICDVMADAGDDISVADPIFTDFGAPLEYGGPAVTLACFENSGLIRLVLEEPGQGAVLAVDGGGSERCALVDAELAELALSNDWAGLIIYGAVRDAEALSQMDLPVKAINVHPRAAGIDTDGKRDTRIRFAGAEFIPGAWVYADLDGVIVCKHEIAFEDDVRTV